MTKKSAHFENRYVFNKFLSEDPSIVGILTCFVDILTNVLKQTAHPGAFVHVITFDSAGKRENAVISKPIPLCIRKLLVRDVQHGEWYRAVARKDRSNKALIGKILLKLKPFESVVDCSGRGMNRKTDAKTDITIIREIKKKSKGTVCEIQGNLQLSISDQIVCRCLVPQGLNSKIP